MNFGSLYIRNFRILEDFEVKKLGRLNLIVGKNNSGKSSVLEALRIYAGGANRTLLTKIADGHDEIYPVDDTNSNNQGSILPFESFFTGRNFPVDEEKSIIISDTKDSDRSLRLEHTFFFVEEIIETDSKEEKSTKIQTRFIPKSKLNEFNDKEIFQGISVLQQKRKFFIPLNGPIGRRFYNPFFETEKNFPCGYIPTQFVSMDELANEWDKIALTEHEAHIKTALRFIEPDFDNLAFIKNDNKRHNKFNRSAIVKIADSKPISLNSMGDGMLRILQLALNVFSAKEGVLLIDEFENGLHYSLQEKVWTWLFNLAEQLNIQVFATTHSWDCVESFTKVALKEKNVSGVLFRVGRSAKTTNKNKIIATEFEPEELARITQADVEVR